MISVFICEDDSKQREIIKKIVSDYISEKELPMELTLVSGNPEELLDYLVKKPNIKGLYFLDIDLQVEMNGILLGAAIRNIDRTGKIVFVTSKGEQAPLTFVHKVEALDFIFKSEVGQVKKQVEDCIQIAYKRSLAEDEFESTYEVKVGSEVKRIPIDSIVFFETSVRNHMLVIYLDNGELEFRGSIKDISSASGKFLRCHKSAVINVEKVEGFYKDDMELLMSNGDRCPISQKGFGELEKQLGSKVKVF